MMNTIYRIDNKGIYVDNYLINNNKEYYNGREMVQIDFNYVEVQPPQGEVVKWKNEEWIVIEEYPVESTPPHEPTEL